MIKSIGFYLHADGLGEVDCSNVLDGNPGIGGSEYAIISLVYYLVKYKGNFNITVYSSEKMILPVGLRVVKVTNLKDAILAAEIDGCEILIFKHHPMWLVPQNIFTLSDRKIKFIVWCHNFVSNGHLNFYCDNDQFIKLVCVGQEQMDLYRDHRAFLKSICIYNGVTLPPMGDCNSLIPFELRENVVTYVGSLIPEKGFFYLAKAWPNIFSSLPDAKLNIIGSGQLYDRNAKMGKWGIAEEAYENAFMQFLTMNGKIHPSVRFLGVLGKEKNDILKVTKVGVPNPSGLTETFGYTAIEMQLMGAKVATMKCPGYLDTVTNGILYSATNELENSVVELCKQPINEYSKVYSVLKERFSYEIIMEKWANLLMEGKQYQNNSLTCLANPNYKMKRQKEFLRRLKSKYPILYILPSIDSVWELFLVVARKLQRVRISLFCLQKN
jgi:glycosyltransferase involved in cell wall biosynthesis